MVKLIHAADFHLDSAFGALGPEKAKERRREGRYLVERLAELTRREGADLLLLSGDLFDGRHVYPETLSCLAETFAALSARVFIAPGNHDPYAPGCPYERVRWPENVHIFRSASVEAVELPELNAVVYGTAFTAPERTDGPLQGFSAPRDGRTHLMVLHGDVSRGESVYGPIRREEIEQSGLSYLALGHVHQTGGLQREGPSFWAYPGCPEGRGFDETGEKGVLVGTVDAETAALRFVPLGRRQYRIITADVTTQDAETAVRQALPPSAAMDVCRVLLTGETEEQGLDLLRLREKLSGLCYELELRDETELRRDIWEGAGEDSLRGLFLRRMREKLDRAETEEERRVAEEALRFGLAALSGREL
ncbi:MAG: exonuclease SbcCD subunit D [Oscillospiraceae bacterium]